MSFAARCEESMPKWLFSNERLVPPANPGNEETARVSSLSFLQVWPEGCSWRGPKHHGLIGPVGWGAGDRREARGNRLRDKAYRSVEEEHQI